MIDPNELLESAEIIKSSDSRTEREIDDDLWNFYERVMQERAETEYYLRNRFVGGYNC